MAFTTPATATAGTVLTAAWLNTYVRDNVAWIATDSPSCRAYNSANISHTTSGTDQAVTLNSERFDNAAVHSTSANTSRFTIPSGGGGKYICGGQLAWAVSSSGAYRAVTLYLNGATKIAQQNTEPSGTHGSDATVVCVYALSAADYVEMFGNQNSGGALNMAATSNTSPEAWVFWFRT